MKPYDYLIVGAGFAGSVCARALADLGKRVRVVEKREHIAGNAFDELDGHGVLVHRYGPHIFHTNSKRVFEFLSRFTTRPFIHIDIAGPAFITKKDSYRTRGGTGVGVRLLYQFLKQRVKA